MPRFMNETRVRRVIVAPVRALLVGASLCLPMAAHAQAQVLFESAVTLVTSGQTTDGAEGIVSSSQFYSGVNFLLPAAAHITGIGGNFTTFSSIGNNSIFGAIVPVAGPEDTPETTDLVANALATTLITLTPGVLEITSGFVDVTLPAGWYAEVFGSGQLGATGEGVAVRTINGQPATANGITTYAIRLSDEARFDHIGARYFVTRAIPEPTSLQLATAGLMLLLASLRARRATP